ncbi:hypothetical protein CONPUDRAFT_153597 [Coniophora puteana RWD-64-598 SS2]|uniref:Uncharacterized protein n=1 Tax=Coniophora puteana (strain RWD-64-598) TaxID=741705 RepID=A0A5M3MPR7_CONPW|nr:uncharacterized protein CONPUDRAFT_153597 [Coniophora puteana RWD-64-598 SS2]EIW81047.1 hypothetical protein CONPUDRAFT_153597 [Coniophora puteana RWD-64-598 SS2]
MSTDAPVVPLLPENALANTYGALYICVVVSAMLFGLTNLQAFFYLRIQNPNNRSLIRYKLAVCWLWILDALHLALVIQLVYFYLVEHFGDGTILDQVVWSFRLQIIISTLVVYSVHCLYAYRVFLISRARRVNEKFAYLACIVVFLASGESPQPS